MGTQVVKKTLHELIDKIEDEQLLNLYVQLLEREVKQQPNDIFDNAEMIDKIKQSIKEVESGKTKKISSPKGISDLLGL